MTKTPDKLVVWRFLDGKAGHRNQVFGLTEALARLTPCELLDVLLSNHQKGIRSLWPGTQSELSQLPCPDLIVGAGHGTHIPMLMARRRFGGRVIVLMKPSLPFRFFDQCFVPAADGVRERSNVLCTTGALNRIVPSTTLESTKGLILLGGPSDHFSWSTESVLEQVGDVVGNSPLVNWTLTTSRRTPGDLVKRWSGMGLRGHLIPVEETGPQWLPEQLKQAGTVWVTADSVSMLYEAITAGGQVGLIELPSRADSRVARGVSALIARKHVQPLSLWKQEGFEGLDRLTLSEADRCARFLLSRLQNERAGKAA